MLLPPTVAMGATLPVVARGLVTRGCAPRADRAPFLYASNTLGAVLGAYLCGFWMIPALGVARSVLVAAAANLAVAAVALRSARRAAPAAPAGARRRIRRPALRARVAVCS